MNGVCLASPSYRYGRQSNLYLLCGVAGQRTIEIDAPKLQVVLEAIISEWYDETFLASSVDQMRQAESLAKIIQFGYAAIPSVVKEISRRPSFLFLALEAITGLNPIQNKDRGDVEAMCGAWIEWYRNSKSVFV